MGYSLFISTILLNLVGVVRKNKSKFIIFVTVLIFWLLFAGNNYNPDYFNYLDLYNQVKLNGLSGVANRDFGYKLIMYFFTLIGAEYEVFVGFISFLGLFLISHIVNKYSPSPNTVFILYSIYPFLLDIVQVRNFLMMAVVLWSVTVLIEKQNEITVKFILIMLLAFSIHYSAILYFPIIVLQSKYKGSISVFINIFVILFSMIVLVNDNQIPFIKIILDIFTDNQYIFDWFNRATEWGFLFFWTMHISAFIFIKWTRKIIATRIQSLEQKDYIFVDTVYWVLLIGFIWFPFYMVSIEFIRILRNLFILIYIAASIANKYLNFHDLYLKIIYNITLVVFTFIFFYFQIYSPHLINVIQTVLENNWFYGN